MVCNIRKPALIAVSMVMLILLSFTLSEISASVQKSFVLDLNNALFIYEENSLNDSSISTEHDFNWSSLNVTYWIQIPKNSTIISASLNVTGKITYIYKRHVESGQLYGLSAGPVESTTKDITLGSTNYVLWLLNGTNGNTIWSNTSFTETVWSTSIGNVTSSEGNEIAVGTNDGHVYLFASDGSVIWDNSSIGNAIYSVAIGELYGSGTNFTVAGSDDNNIYVFNPDGTLNWSVSVGNSVRSVAIGNVTADSGNEIVAACSGGNLYILNSSGSIVSSTSIGTSTLNSVAIGNVTSDYGNEIAVASTDGRVYILNTSLSIKWNYSAGQSVKSVEIDDVITDYDGNEVVFGSQDKKIYTLTRAGHLIWSFEAEDYVNSISTGDITSDTGTEVAAGTRGGYLYTFNFDYFPTNLTLDIGANGTADWTSPYTKLRNTTTIIGIESSIQYYLDNVCTTSLCDVPLLFNTTWPGRLNISDINITYYYNASPIIQITNLSIWSRTYDVRTNESVGNLTKNVTFVSDPDVSITVGYIKLPPGAVSCDFNGVHYTNTTYEGQNVCDIPDFSVSSGGWFTFWDSTMPSAVPVRKSETQPYYTNTTDNFYSIKNITIWNETGSTIFYNITSNTTLESSVLGLQFLKVYWNSSWHNITPSAEDSGCDGSSPSYQYFSIGQDTFRVCRKGNFFKWIQPRTNGETQYQAGGSTNLPPVLSNANVTPSSGLWGEWFNFSVQVNDTNNDDVNVTLWVYANTTDTWVSIETKNISGGNGFLWFNTTLGREFSGQARYKFEYQDFNSSTGYAIHSPSNTTESLFPTILKHNATVTHSSGNESVVNRTETVLLSVLITDDDTGQPAANSTCIFWITTDGENFDSGFSNSTNESGYCNYYFTPNSSYDIGNQTWKAGFQSNPYYNDVNSSDFVLTIKGKMNISIVNPRENQSLRRNYTNTLSARLVDQFGNPVGLQGYNCTFWVDGTMLGYNDTNSSGDCIYEWSPSCSYPLGSHIINVTVSGPGNENYTLYGSSDHASFYLKDALLITISQPHAYTLYHKGDLIPLNASVNDTCSNCSESDYTLTWYKKYKHRLVVNIRDLSGKNITNRLFIINGSTLLSNDVYLNDWLINNTRVMLNGNEIPSAVYPWNTSAKRVFNSSQTYLGEYSEIVFISDMQAYENKTFEIWYNTSRHINWNTDFIRNGGFEGEGFWDCSSDSCGDYCSCGRVQTNGPEGNYSYLLSAKGVFTNNLVTVSQNISFSTNYIKIAFNLTGDFSMGSYLRLESSSGAVCELNTTAKNQWVNQTCYNETPFSGSITIKLHDFGNAGASSIYIDYICVANSSGDCITHHTGAAPSMSFVSQETIGTGNTTWATTLSDAAGLRRIVANASGNPGRFRLDAKEDVYVYLYGWSAVSGMNITQGGGCTYGTAGFKCAQAANITSWCSVIDANTSLPVYNVNVSFYGDGLYIGSNTTNETGVAVFTWYDSTTAVGNHTITCNITDDPDAYYNATENNSLSMSFLVSNGTTTAKILLNPQNINATGITVNTQYNFTLGINVTNTGIETMLSPQINISAPTGITATGVSCGDIPPQSYCYRESHISVSVDAATGNNALNITVRWNNFKQGSTGNTTNATLVFVANNTVIFINKTLINATLSAGSSGVAVGSFIIENLGNVQIPYISIYEVGGNISNMTGWINYSQSEVTNLPKHGNVTISVSVTIPGNTTEGIYRTNITANATSSVCSPETNCHDSLLLELNVTPFDWNVDKTSISKTVGLNSQNGTISQIVLTNYKAVNYTISLSITGSGYITLGQSSLTLPAYSTSSFYVYHNSSGGYVFGNYTANITLTNQNGGLPHERNITVLLEVINFTVRIVSPNSTSPSSIINTSALREGKAQYINLTVNATWQSSFLPDNVTWSVTIGGRSCTVVSNSSNSTDQLWHINCSVPDIPDNPIAADLTVTGTYTTQGVSISDTQNNAIRYDDVTPPQITSISSLSGDSEGNVRYSSNTQYLLFNVIATDNTGVQSVSANVTYLENGTSVYTGSLQWLYGNTWRLNFTNPNWQGDYKIIITATDSSSHHWENTTNNLSIGYFDVYVPINFTGQFNDVLGNPLDIDFEFYKPGTSWRIHSFSTNSSGGSFREIHKRSYDIKAKVFGSAITFRSVNFSASDSVSNPFRFDDVSGDLSNMGLPNSAETGALIAIAVNTSNITFSSADVIFNYTNINNLQNYDESKFRVYVCDSWNFDSRICSSTLSYLSSSYTQDVSANTFAFSVPHFSAYAIAKACLDSNGDPVTCTTGGTGTTGGTTGGGGTAGGGGTGGTSGTTLTPPATVPSTTTPFTIKTGISNINIHPGENRTYPMIIRNRLDRPITVRIDISELGQFIVPDRNVVNISASGNETVRFHVSVPESAGTGTYTGLITVSAEGKSQEIPVTLSVTYEGTSYLSLDVKLITPTVTREGDVKFSVIMRNTGLKSKFNVTLVYTIREGESDYIIKQQNETMTLENDLSFTRTISLKGTDAPYGEYVLEVMALFEDKSVREIEIFKVAESFWETPLGATIPWIVLVTGLAFAGYYARKRYIKWKLEKARYLFPLDYRKIPQESENAFKIGKIAETDHTAWFNPKDLTTHMIVAGSTGAGKSVSASVFAEEALEQKIPVVVFDPTAQWTGFVKACSDENLLMYYPMFGMDTRDAHPYKGMIFEITDPQDLLFELKKGFKRYLNPGEITVFTLNKLKPGQYDEAVQYIIDALFSIPWEESTELRLIIIFDEVHRLLEKYGGKGGYISLEKAAREFRKWGIGMIMCSQVLADFKEAIAGNVLTEVQLNTKSITDIQKVESKYGAEYARRISRQGIGVGMLQNPKYNDGKPYFVHFRPTYHNPHKITNEEMEIYKEFAKRLEAIEVKIEQMKQQKQDVFDIELELKLAKDKLKQGRFRMAKIYITSLEQHLNIR